MRDSTSADATTAVIGAGWSSSAGAQVGGISPDLKMGAVKTILCPPTE